jgi:hypothetical protein
VKGPAAVPAELAVELISVEWYGAGVSINVMIDVITFMDPLTVLLRVTFAVV